jgi:hypothetical protein
MSHKDNPYLKDPNADPAVQTAANIDVMNAMSAVILDHGRHYEKLFEKFKKMFDDSHLRLWIVFAGVGGMVELLRLLVDFGRFLWCHYR